jgi:hypothetical protein
VYKKKWAGKKEDTREPPCKYREDLPYRERDTEKYLLLSSFFFFFSFLIYRSSSRPTSFIPMYGSYSYYYYYYIIYYAPGPGMSLRYEKCRVPRTGPLAPSNRRL